MSHSSSSRPHKSRRDSDQLPPVHDRQSALRGAPGADAGLRRVLSHGLPSSADPEDASARHRAQPPPQAFKSFSMKLPGAGHAHAAAKPSQSAASTSSLNSVYALSQQRKESPPKANGSSHSEDKPASPPSKDNTHQATKTVPMAEPPWPQLPKNWINLAPVQDSSHHPSSSASKSSSSSQHQGLRYNGQGLKDQPSDPRKDKQRIEQLKSGPLRNVKGLIPVSYKWDRYSVGEPPKPKTAALVVTNIDPLVSSQEVRQHFQAYGSIECFDLKSGPNGSSLGIAYVRFVDHTYLDLKTGDFVTPPHKQDGGACASEAAINTHKRKIGSSAAAVEGRHGVVMVKKDEDNNRAEREVTAVLKSKQAAQMQKKRQYEEAAKKREQQLVGSQGRPVASTSKAEQQQQQQQQQQQPRSSSSSTRVKKEEEETEAAKQSDWSKNRPTESSKQRDSLDAPDRPVERSRNRPSLPPILSYDELLDQAKKRVLQRLHDELERKLMEDHVTPRLERSLKEAKRPLKSSHPPPASLPPRPHAALPSPSQSSHGLAGVTPVASAHNSSVSNSGRKVVPHVSLNFPIQRGSSQANALGGMMPSVRPNPAMAASSILSAQRSMGIQNSANPSLKPNLSSLGSFKPESGRSKLPKIAKTKSSEPSTRPPSIAESPEAEEAHTKRRASNKERDGRSVSRSSSLTTIRSSASDKEATAQIDEERSDESASSDSEEEEESSEGEVEGQERSDAESSDEASVPPAPLLPQLTKGEKDQSPKKALSPSKQRKIIDWSSDEDDEEKQQQNKEPLPSPKQKPSHVVTNGHGVKQIGPLKPAHSPQAKAKKEEAAPPVSEMTETVLDKIAREDESKEAGEKPMVDEISLNSVDTPFAGAPPVLSAEELEARAPPTPALPKPQPAKPARGGKKKLAEPFELQPKTPGAIDLYRLGLVADEEDFYFLRQALMRRKAGKPMRPDADEQEQEIDEDRLDLPLHSTGSARTEGYYKRAAGEKAAYLPQRNKARVQTNGPNNASSVNISRSSRAETRRLAQGVSSNATSDSDIIKFNQLKSRGKLLKFSRSPIHDWGLYAMERIERGDLVIEYIGELIRQQIADKREMLYERSGIGSSYLFRVDDDFVVDATKKGSMSRLINHSCNPNCIAKIITINGSKKIVIYARQVIEPGDEITYDYKFAVEAAEFKIPCLCGAPNCRRYLN